MATWRVRAGPALFRNVSFHIESTELAGGRKTVVHEYPLRDQPFVEDLGRRAQALTVEGYVIGDDFIEQRDALLEALQAPGPGRLLLPYLGFVTVAVGGFAVRDTREEGGIARLQIEFLETAESPLFPVAAADATADVDISVEGLLDAAQARLPKIMSTVGQPSAFLRSLSSVVSSAGNAINAALAPINTAVGAVTGAVDQATQFAADVKRQVDDIILDADSLVRSPFVAASRFRNVFESLFESPQLPPRNLQALLEAYNFVPDTPRPAETTSNREREATNYDALQTMVQQMVVASAARFAPRVEFETFEDSVATRDQITELLDAQIEVADDDLLPALTDLRASLVQAVPGESSDLPRLLSFTPPTSTSSLVVAHRLYGNVDRELEIVSRNRIRHPGFILGGRELQVLSDA